MNDSAKIIPVSFIPKESHVQPTNSQFIKVGKEKPQAPEGNYIARCVHVEPNWTFRWNRKVAIYFEISEGEQVNKTARRFYPLHKLHDGTFEIAPKSKLMKDIKRIFPEYLHKGEIDPVAIFQGKFFDITVEKRISKDGELNSIVTDIALHNLGF